MTRTGIARLVGLSPILIGIFVALVLMLRPLPSDSRLGWCGPGATSDSAIQVLINPDVVLDPGDIPGAGEPTQSDYVLRSWCTGQARDRAIDAVLWLIGGIVVGGILGVAVLASSRSGAVSEWEGRRWP